MKSLKILLVLLTFSLVLSCDTDKDDIDLSAAEANELRLMVQQSDWRITQFTLNNTENTAYYSDYIFSFEEPNTLSATSSVDQVIGTWRINNDSGSEFDSYYDVDFHVFFSSESKLGELSHNYDVISATNQEIRLALQANANGDTATLTFSKN